jgi:hypothetical protein
MCSLSVFHPVGDKAWNQWNHGSSAKPWNEC